MNEKNNLTTYSYHEELVEFGQYDIMFPQITNHIHKEVKFGCDADLKEYFEHYYKFLLNVGFKKKEIEDTASEFFRTSSHIHSSTT
jgi:hypothetical protein|tara:strand:+ start:718 stop:975 length:258 start_codon:yes stop_codon:yes gene_type:complete